MPGIGIGNGGGGGGFRFAFSPQIVDAVTGRYKPTWAVDDVVRLSGGFLDLWTRSGPWKDGNGVTLATTDTWAIPVAMQGLPFSVEVTGPGGVQTLTSVVRGAAVVVIETAINTLAYSTIEGEPLVITPDVTAVDDVWSITSVSLTSGVGAVSFVGRDITFATPVDSAGQSAVIALTITDGDGLAVSESIAVSIDSADIQANLPVTLRQMTSAETIADAWSDLTVPTAANFQGIFPVSSIVTEGGIAGVFSTGNLTAAITAGATVAGRITVTDDRGNTEVFQTLNWTVASSTATAPVAPVTGSATLVDQPDAAGNKLLFTITALPADGGSTITGLKYQLGADGTTWGPLTTLAGSGVGSFVITAPVAEALTYIQWLAVNAVGDGAVSTDTISATPSIPFELGSTNSDITATGSPGEYVATVTAPAAYVGSYTFNTSALAAGPILLKTPPLTGGTTVGSTVTAVPALVVTYQTENATRTYQYQTSTDGTTGWANLSGATAMALVLQTAQAGKYLRRVESLTTTAGTTTSTTAAILLDAATAARPLQMAAPVLSGGIRSFTITRGASAGDGGSPVLGWRFRYRKVGDATWIVVDNPASPYAVTGLANDASYEAQQLEYNSISDGPWSPSGTVTTNAAVFTAPTINSANNGTINVTASTSTVGLPTINSAANGIINVTSGV